jgi:flagellar biogenesis protein FliO
MPRPKIRGLVWSPEDEAAFRKWRRAVLVVYACLGLVLVAAWGVHRLANGGPDNTTAESPLRPSASVVPATVRR